MSPPEQHPSAQLSADYRVGDITPGAALAIAVHLAACLSCCLAVQEQARRRDEQWTRAIEPGAIAADAALPPMLQGTPRGQWRRVGRGVAAAQLQGVSGLAQSAQLVRAAPGAKLALPEDLDILVGLGGSIDGDWGELSVGGLIEPAVSAVARADPKAGFLGLAIGSDTLYRGFFSRLFS